MQTILSKYADLLVNYCLELKEGEQVLVNTTILAEPLVREVYRQALRVGAHIEVDFQFREKQRIFMQEASDAQLRHVSPFFQQAMTHFDAYLFIRAPYNLRENAATEGGEKGKIRSEAMNEMAQIYAERTAKRGQKGGMKRNLCQFPTDAAAQEAGMSLEEYEQFVYQACKLYEPDPKNAWLEVRKSQQRITDFLNKSKQIHYLGNNIDLTFSCEGRTWINSDGQTNMPSGEVYTSPLENSVNGTVRFSFPSIYNGHEVEGVTLAVKNGYIEHWEATRGKDFLDKIFAQKGTRRFGEAAIGTNYGINRMTKNILFDEKIGGTVHLAIGQSYLQCGGLNQSPVHWDMITDMTNNGQIWADGEKIYENGLFLI